MKEYKRMWKIKNGVIEEIAVSMITKTGWIKYYPIKNDKIFKKRGLQEECYESRHYSFVNTLEEATIISKQYYIRQFTIKLEQKEEMLLKIPCVLKRIKEEYLNDFKKAKETELLLQKEIAKLKEQIDNMKGVNNDMDMQ